MTTITLPRATVEQALEALTAHADLLGTMYLRMDAIAALRAALAQQAEPVVGVVWGVDWGRDGDRACASIVKKRADGSVEIVAVEYAPYTAPPQRKPLTKEQLLYIYNQLPNWGMDMDRLPQGLEKFARAVERAHGITDPATPACPDCHGIPMPEGDPK